MFYGSVNPKMALGVQGLFDTSSTQKLPLGTRVDLGDGRSFVYGKAGASALDPFKLCQSSAPVPNHKECAFVSTAADNLGKNTKVTVTLGATLASVNQYADGFALVSVGTGIGQIFKVRTHPAAAQSASVQLQLYDEVITAMSASDSKVTLIKHPADGAIVAPTTLTGTLLGVPLVTIAIGYYGWFQVRGPASLLTDADSAVIVGATVMPSAETAGAVEVYSLNSVDASGQQPVVGVVMAVQEDTEYSMIDLRL